MKDNGNDRSGSPLPEAFCWTKFGHEAGESSGSIFRRKELERQRNGGVFLWGIGQSVMPSLLDLLRITDVPAVFFSPIKTRSAARDVFPDNVLLWTQAFGYDGQSYGIPPYSVVTSRASSRSSHYALVCESVTPIDRGVIDYQAIDVSRLRNLVSGSMLGPSQVTSVVRYELERERAGSVYEVAARARLMYPYMVRLTAGVTVPSGLELGNAFGAESAVERLLGFKRQIAIDSDFLSQSGSRRWIQEMLPAEFGFTRCASTPAVARVHHGRADCR